jgi:acyl-CoA reductase-like NAD-dependent aldehyde dehydrogenase
MELSGCDAVFVREDANLDLVTRAIRFSFRLNRSETCIAPRRIFVHRSLAGELEQKLVKMADALQGVPERTPAARFAANLISQAVEKGARQASGTVLPGKEGITPTVMAGVTAGMGLLEEDVFAPVVSIVPVDGDEDALTMASSCPYALGATIFGAAEGPAWVLAQRVRAGGVTINDVVAPTADPRLPFGGRGKSGFGMTRGVEGLLDVTTPKVVTVRRGKMIWHLDSPQPDDPQFFSDYILATNSPSLKKRLGAWRRVLPIMLRKMVGK